MPATLDRSALQQALQAVEPAVLLVSPRLLRRVVEKQLGPVGLGHAIQSGGHRIGRAELLQLVDHVDLGIPASYELHDPVLLLAAPRSGDFDDRPADDILLGYWRRLFHARVDQTIDRLVEQGKLTDPELRRRVLAIDPVVFDGVRTVLVGENLTPTGADDRVVYREFSALYLELRYFAPDQLPAFFPGVAGRLDIDRMLETDAGGASSFAATRPAETPDPAVVQPDPPEDDEWEADDDLAPPLDPAADPISVTPAQVRGLTDRADRESARGNTVRAALLRWRAAHGVPVDQSAGLRASAGDALSQLTDRLRHALRLMPEQESEWRRALEPLLEPASRGVWPNAARLLYDLQKACVDTEKPLFAVDLVEWAVSLGRRPIKRPLTSPREVLVLRHLRSAYRRLARIRVGESDRARLAKLMRSALHAAEDRLRDGMRPALRDVLHGVGLKPANLPEEISFDKLVEELLDRASDRGHLTMGDLRDALARNQVKLPDLAGPGQFFAGDPLLKANARLSVALDGVYRRGEIYLRWLQRFSSVAFGTALGRWVTRYLALPFGGAFVALEGIQHLIGAAMKGMHAVAAVFLPHAPLEANPDDVEAVASAPHPPEHVTLVTWWSVLLFGAFLLALLYRPSFRQAVGRGLMSVWRGVKAVLGLPSDVLQSPLVRPILDNALTRAFRHYLLLPTALGIATGLLFYEFGADAMPTWEGTAAIFAASVLVFNTRLGRDIEDLGVEALGRVWRVVRVNLVPGLIGLILELFKRLLEAIEWVLYTVDEWLRFRGGEGPVRFAGKLVLGVVWFLVTYVIRFGVNLLIEPQVNPIKHFPVVTVSHKILAPFLIGLIPLLEPTLGKERATTIWFFTQLLLPGVFGFLVWEFKENWRLYRANRAPALLPAVIGAHGESMRRLLRLGFHSGTVPRLFARLRKAERSASATGNRRGIHRTRLALEHVEEELRRFFDRELLALLRASRTWGGRPVRLGDVVLEPNRVRAELLADGGHGEPLWVGFALHGGRVWAGVLQPGWLSSSNHEQRQTVRDVLGGLYKRAFVELVREQLAATVGPAVVVRGDGLHVWSGPAMADEAVYPFEGKDILTADRPQAPEFPADEVLLKRRDVPWGRWVEVWELDRAGKGHPEPLLPGWQFLPARQTGLST
jgi:hypothetical protein